MPALLLDDDGKENRRNGCTGEHRILCGGAIDKGCRRSCESFGIPATDSAKALVLLLLVRLEP